MPSRLAYVALMLVSLAMTAVVAALWLTEPSLPARTQIAFAVMSLIGISWSVFAAWVLTRRRILLARHRIVAGRMAVTFTSVFLLGALAVGYTTGGAAPYAAAAMGGTMLAIAVFMLLRAHRAVARLTERRDTLQHELRGTTR
jgi:hypothetical protein